MREQEKTSNDEESKSGVLGFREENNHYVVNIRWKDGVETESHFPSRGFEVVNPSTGERLGFMKGERALQILKEHAAEYANNEFSWRNFM